MNERIVLITDPMKSITSADVYRRDLEGNSTVGTQKIKAVLEKIFDQVIHYTDIEEFTNNIKYHKNDIIFPLLYGLNSVNSKSLIPAICESNQLKYIGADSYTHALCNDKYISKLYAKEFGINSAQGVLIRHSNNKSILKYISALKLPLIVKPNFGGGSTGISVNNVLYSYKKAVELISLLLESHNIPILVEEYVEGYEVEFIIVGNKKEIKFAEEVKLIMNNEDYFKKSIWGYETKKLDDSSINFQSSELLTKKERQKLVSLFQSFEKIEFMRIDGRFNNGNFYLIELSPDSYLGDDCAFYYAFQNKGFSYKEMFRIIIQNAQVLY